jgi:hypothetical protein
VEVEDEVQLTHVTEVTVQNLNCRKEEGVKGRFIKAWVRMFRLKGGVRKLGMVRGV